MSIDEIRITLGSEEDQESGLLAYVACRYGDLQLDGLVVRKTTDGRLLVTFPGKARNGCGRRYFITPRSSPVRLLFEKAILAAFREASS